MIPLLPAKEEAFTERGLWRRFGAGWRQLYGGFDHHGVSLEAHDFLADKPLDWGKSFHPDSLEVCVNLEGEAAIDFDGERVALGPGMAVYFRVGREPVRASRAGGQRHRFVSVECRRDFLSRTLAGCEQALDTPLRESLPREHAPGFAGKPRPLTPAQAASAERLWQPGISPSALPVWYHGVMLEMLAEHLFPPEEELFCSRHKRVMRERVARAVAIIERDLSEVPPLEKIARETGASPFHLSRMFSEEMRMTIPQFVRLRRIERAAEMIRAGTHNVTEAAFAVGYSGLGHFSKAFAEVFGCLPSEYGGQPPGE